MGVHTLWCQETCSWKEDLLNQLFSRDDIGCIKAIRLSPRHPVDTLRWKFTDDGMYSVKSGYRSDFSAWWSSTGHSSSQNISKETWRSVWNLEGPPRLLNFLWSIMDNSIPVRENLRKRGLIEDSICPLCNDFPETSTHLFMECRITQRWLLAEGFFSAFQVRPSFSMAWELLTQQRSRGECGKILAGFWGLWKVRNMFVFDNPNQAEIPRILSRALKFHEDYLAVHTGSISTNSKNNPRWSPPPMGFVKVNTDAGVVYNKGGQVSAIARDDGGNFIGAAVKIIPAVKHPTLLEAYGVLLALDLIREFSCCRVIVESDCQPLVLALQSGRNSKNDLAILVEDCIEASKAVEEISFSFVTRNANVPAHILAKAHVPFLESVMYYATPPVSIFEALLQDVTNDV